MKRQIVASTKKYSFVQAASTAKMIDAFEGKLENLQGSEVESATEVTDEDTSEFTSEQQDVLWDIDDAYDGDVLDEEVPGIILEIKHKIMDELGFDEETAKRAMVDVLMYDPESIPSDASASESVKCAGQLQLFGDDGYHNYEDTDGSYTGVPGSFVTLAELKNHWNDFYDDDPVLNEEYQPDEGQRWLADTLSHMKEVDEDVDAATDANTEEIDEDLEPVKGEENWNEDNVFMLMGYTGGTEGPESDRFDCYGKFFAKDEGDADHQLWEAKQADPERMQFIENAYTTPYNDYFDDGDEVYPDLATLVKSAWIAPNDYDGNMYDDDLPFASTQAEGNAIEAALIVNDEEVADTIEDAECEPVQDPIDASLIVNEEEVADTIENVECVPVNDPIDAALIIDDEEVADTIEDIECAEIMDGEEVAEPIEGGLFDDYFGKEQAEKFGDLICDNLSGQTISKRKDLAEQPGGLIYEANQLGIDMWDLLEALEGLCYQGKAYEIDDSTYKVK